MSMTSRRLGIIGLLIALVGLFVTLSRCGGDSGGGGSDDYAYVFSGAVAVPDAAALALDEKTVTFTLNWNETDGKIDGTYQDDHFAAEPATVTGEVAADGTRTLTIVLASAKNGVSKLVVVTDKVTGAIADSLILASFSGLSAADAVVFAKAGITISTKKAGTVDAGGDDGEAPAGDAGVLFTRVAGDYDFYAKNTNAKGDGTTWTHGKKYKISITQSGKVTFATDGQPVDMTYGTGPGDNFEKYDHEEYAILNSETAKALVQEQFEPKNFFVTYQVLGDGGAFWVFQKEDPGPAPNALTVVGIGYAVGTYKSKITNLSPDDADDYAVDDPVEITITADGHATGTFGDFAFVGKETSVTTGTSGDKSTGGIVYYRPSATEYPRWSLELAFVDEKWTRATLVHETQAGSNIGRLSYNVVAP